ncbi:MAG: hypothetical protein JWN21_1078 [Sphingomonas bacterium]|uniref:pilus assembly protein TadG-related protein n=1 Tax=Sphingomonas bacterium TaxID=1895847 RepID=UPI0026374A08|nr:pilus assembly protein TadG-related protein [Sphingomonas bacterium]MDB5695535.1 hypothetical protein [Sphingomonas bacterium]
MNDGTFLQRLRRDTRGNTLAIMAATLVPLCGVVGGGIDVGRMYIAKTRLQHACDAGALAGRKAMGGGTWAQTVNGVAEYPRVSAERFFDANYKAGSYGSADLAKSFTEAGGKVSGTASVNLPMTLMRVFSIDTQPLSVTCASEMRLPNTDIMFVLDTTGSMAETPTGDTQTKMASLKVAVKCFYEIVAKLDTAANCTTGAPAGGTGSQTQIRFGFVPYATNVNVGYLLKPEWLADSWKYQSREPEWTATTTYTYPPYSGTPGPSSSTTGTWSAYANSSTTGQTTSAQTCTAPADDQSQSSSTTNSAVAQSGTTRTYTSTTTVSTTYNRYTSSSVQSGYGSDRRYYCQIKKSSKTDTSTTSTNYSSQGVPTTTNSFSRWHYGQIAQNIAGLKNGTSWNSGITLPIGSSGTAKYIGWDGCIEERETVRASSYNPIPSGAYDLNIDLVPTSGTASSLWGPALPGMLYARKDSSGNYTLTDQYTATEYTNDSSYSCPTAAKKLQAWTNASLFDSYVDSLSPSGNTYHDIGLIWGGRLMSPTGIFASENALTSAGGAIERNLIFMTDGDPCTSIANYQAYGFPYYDRRQTDPAAVPSDGCTTNGTLTQQVNARTEALCSAIKNKNITLWVITFGTLDANTNTRMTNCASPGRYFSATNAATLQSTFQSIANQISQLRLTQ